MAFDNRTYRRALEAQTRRIDNYERVHFRKSHMPKAYESVTGFEPTQETSVYSYTNHEPLLQPRVLEFSRATAKAFLQQTESLWLNLDLSRTEATEQLLDRKVGAFFVRSSTKAKFALTVRVEGNNPPVMHFLVHCNDQGFYIIQGSNLQFVGLYDLLAFFCFQKSGGMPCLLRPPVKGSNRDSYLLDSDSGESDCEEEEWVSGENGGGDSLLSPPGPGMPPYDEIKHYHDDQSSANDTVPPPLPPRRRPAAGQCAYFEVSTETLNRVSRVSSLVDHDTGNLINQVQRNEEMLSRRRMKTNEEPTPPTPITGESRNHMDPVRPPYKNFQIMSGSPSSTNRISQHYELSMPHYEVAPAIKELVSPLYGRLPQTDEQPPAIPPKTIPPPIPPKGMTKEIESPIESPPPLPPKPKLVPPVKKPRSNTHYPPESEYSQSRITMAKKLGHRRVSSDSSIISGSTTLSEDLSLPNPLTPPPLPPNHPNRLPLETEKAPVKQESIEKEWIVIDKPEKPNPAPLPTSPTGGQPQQSQGGRKWKKPRWAKKIRKWRLKPSGRVKKFVLELSDDTNREFGARVHYFIETILIKSDPHQKLFSDVRKFMGKMRELLLTDYKMDLLIQGMDSCKNFEHLLENSLQQCIIQPMHSFLYTRLEENLTQNGSMGQMKTAIENALNKTPEELGIRSHLLAPNDKSLQEINGIFTKIKQSYNAMRKMEYLLEAVRLTYEGVRDVNNPKKQMHDLGADDFLPLFVWVLAHTNFYTAEIEAEYIWGLAHPSLFNGEGGYYLTTLTSAVNVLKESCVDCNTTDGRATASDLPNMNSLKTQLPICVQDPLNGKIGLPVSVPVLPTMTVSEICDVLASQYNITESQLYGLYTETANKVTKLKDNDYPQEIILGWALQSDVHDDRDSKLIYKKEM